jgi:hypothetical protein
MISHDRAEELISARLDAPLSAADHQAVQAHLAICPNCRAFAAQADALVRGLNALPTLAPSPIVTRGVMAAIASENSGWDWLRRSVRLLSSPGLAVASGLALTIALAATLLITLNAPRGGTGSQPEGTIAAVAVAPLPTERPTEPPPPPTVAPTATTAPQRAVEPARTVQPAKTPTPRPTATSVPIEQVAVPVTNQQPAVEPGSAPVEQPPIEPAAGDATLAMAPADAAADTSTSTTDMAQEAVQEQPANDQSDQRGKGGGRKASSDAGSQEAAPTEAAAAPMTEPVQVPEQAINAMNDAGTSPDAYLPPAPLAPAPPQQAFLPITPTPVDDGTPTPQYDPESGVPQLAEDSSGDLGVAALAPDAPSGTTVDNGEVKSRNKHDKSTKDGKAAEQQQAAFMAEPMGWSMSPVLLMQTVENPDGTGTAPTDTTSGETTDAPAAPADTSTAPTDTTTAPTDATGETAAPAETTTETTASDQPLQIDPATGLAIDPRTGLLIDPRTGYLLDPATGLIYDPRTGYQVHPMTGLLIDPISGAQLDPVTLAVVIPPGFGSDQPAYVPGSPSMRGDIENVVNTTYDNATIQIAPPTDGPVQPVDEIIIPTQAGDAVEISGGSDQP